MVVSNVGGARCPRLLTAGDALHLARRRVGPTGPRRARPDDRLRRNPPLPESKDDGSSFAKILRALVSETERPQNARRRSRKKWPRPVRAISARVRLVRQEAAGEVPTMTALWVVEVYAGGPGPPAGTGAEA